MLPLAEVRCLAVAVLVDDTDSLELAFRLGTDILEGQWPRFRTHRLSPEYPLGVGIGIVVAIDPDFDGDCDPDSDHRSVFMALLALLGTASRLPACLL